MKAVRLAAIFVFAGAMAWLLAATSSPTGSAVPSFGGWDAAFVLMGVALGSASINIWRLHERVERLAVHFVLGVLLLAAGLLGVLTVRFESPIRTAAPVLLMIGNAWTMVALAAKGRVAGKRP